MTDRRPDLAGLVPIPTYRDAPATQPSDLSGVDLAGGPVTVEVTAVDHWTLLVFLSMSCEGCRHVWGALEQSVRWPDVDDVRTVVVVRRPDAAEVAASGVGERVGVPVVVSDDAYGTYRVSGPPFFVVVDGPASRVATEGVAWEASQVADAVQRARRGLGGTRVPRLEPRATP